MWFMAGSAAGMYALAKARRTVQAFTPDGIGARVAALGAGARVFVDQVAEGMAEREQQLLAQLELPPADRPLLEKRPTTEASGGAPAPTSSISSGGADGHS
jgi:hypothetical protein